MYSGHSISALVVQSQSHGDTTDGTVVDLQTYSSHISVVQELQSLSGEVTGFSVSHSVVGQSQSVLHESGGLVGHTEQSEILQYAQQRI